MVLVDIYIIYTLKQRKIPHFNFKVVVDKSSIGNYITIKNSTHKHLDATKRDRDDFSTETPSCLR